MPLGLDVSNTAEQEKDVLGGFTVLDTGVYKGTIKHAFMGESSGGAKSVTLDFTTDEGQSFKTTIYITSGRVKGSKTYYEKDGKQHNLPGYNVFNAICELGVSKVPNDMETEEKVINLYNYEEQKEIPTKVPMLMELLDVEIAFGIEKQIVDKNTKDGNGNYVPSGETREQNELVKVFNAAGMTLAEAKANAETATFIHSWKEKNDGKVRNKAKGTSGNTGTAGTPATAAKPAPTKSLFT